MRLERARAGHRAAAGRRSAARLSSFSHNRARSVIVKRLSRDYAPNGRARWPSPRCCPGGSRVRLARVRPTAGPARRSVAALLTEDTAILLDGPQTDDPVLELL